MATFPAVSTISKQAKANAYRATSSDFTLASEEGLNSPINSRKKIGIACALTESCGPIRHECLWLLLIYSNQYELGLAR